MHIRVKTVVKAFRSLSCVYSGEIEVNIGQVGEAGAFKEQRRMFVCRLLCKLMCVLFLSMTGSCPCSRLPAGTVGVHSAALWKRSEDICFCWTKLTSGDYPQCLVNTWQHKVIVCFWRYKQSFHLSVLTSVSIQRALFLKMHLLRYKTFITL